jgi:hypothetical protein
MLRLLATAGLATVLAAPAFAQQTPSSNQMPGQSGHMQMQQQGQAGGRQAT